jgi:radical SAM superfamily enzyme YgiQ (UPF0313 family)
MGKINSRSFGTGKFFSEEINKPPIYAQVPRKFKRYGIPIDSFKEQLGSIPKPEVILVTSIMTYWYPGVHEAVYILKKYFPNTPVILGGIYATLCNGFASSYSKADVVFEGSNIRQLLSIIENLTYTRADFKYTNFLEWPNPAFSLYKYLDYSCVLTSIGCPFKCTYCASQKLNPEFLQRPVDSVVREIIQRIEENKVIDFAFYDDALFVNSEKHIKPILKNIADFGVDLRLHSPNGLHARFLDEELAYLLNQAGFKTIRLSLESSDPKTLSETGNKINVTEMKKAVNNLLTCNFTPENIAVYIMMGIPGQTFEEVEETIEFVHSLGVQSRLSMYSPIPETLDFDKMKRQMPTESLDDPLNHNNTYQYYSGKWYDFEKRKYLYDKAYKENQFFIG